MEKLMNRNPAERFRVNHPAVPHDSGLQPAPTPPLSTFGKIKLALVLKSNMKNINFASWKTGLAGIIGLAAVIVPQFFPAYAAIMAQIATVAASLGLLAARDNGVTSEQAGAK